MSTGTTTTDTSLCRACCECCIGGTTSPPSPWDAVTSFCVYLRFPLSLGTATVPGLDPPTCGGVIGQLVPPSVYMPAGDASRCPGDFDPPAPPTVCPEVPIRADRVRPGRWEGAGQWGCQPVCLRIVYRVVPGSPPAWWLWVHIADDRAFCQQLAGPPPTDPADPGYPFGLVFNRPPGTLFFQLPLAVGGTVTMRRIAEAVPAGVRSACGVRCDVVRPNWCVTVGPPEALSGPPGSTCYPFQFVPQLRDAGLAALAALSGTYEVRSRQAACWQGGGVWWNGVTPFHTGFKILYGDTCPPPSSTPQAFLTGYYQLDQAFPAVQIDTVSFAVTDPTVPDPITIDGTGWTGYAAGHVNYLSFGIPYRDCFRLPVTIYPCLRLDAGGGGFVASATDPTFAGAVTPLADDTAATVLAAALGRGCSGCGGPAPATTTETDQTRCAYLGLRLEVRPDCLSGFGCRHECRNGSPAVAAHLAPHAAETTPRTDCGPDCPGYAPTGVPWDWRTPTLTAGEVAA